ncbi:MAG: hypothetical protein ACFB4J_11220 [Elainellaceae cyanobacterium]
MATHLDGPGQVERLNGQIHSYCQKQALEGKWDREDATYFAVALDGNSGLGLINFYIERIKRFYEQYRDKKYFFLNRVTESTSKQLKIFLAMFTEPKYLSRKK